MARPRTAMRKIRELLHLVYGVGMSQRQAVEALHIGKGTVSEILRRARDTGISWPVPAELDDAALEARLYPKHVTNEASRPLPDWCEVHTELAKKGVTLWLLWEEYRTDHPTGLGYSQFCNLYRSWAKRLDVVMRHEHRAGEKLFSDFSGDTIPIYTSRTSEQVAFRAELFVTALGVSGKVFAKATRTQQLATWVLGHQGAFEYYNGVPAICVPDNPLAVVTKANRYEATLNRTFEEMATYYGTCIIPARPNQASR